jgi:hypothetical protein
VQEVHASCDCATISTYKGTILLVAEKNEIETLQCGNQHNDGVDDAAWMGASNHEEKHSDEAKHVET